MEPTAAHPRKQDQGPLVRRGTKTPPARTTNAVLECPSVSDSCGIRSALL